MATSLMERAWYANVWTGLNDLKTKGLYQWSDGTPVTWTNWYVGQPDERRTDKSCVFMSLQSTKRGWMFWRDANCSNTFAFMCKQNIGKYRQLYRLHLSLGKNVVLWSGSLFKYVQKYVLAVSFRWCILWKSQTCFNRFNMKFWKWEEVGKGSN